MQNPILIFLERHWDHIPSKVASVLLKRMPDYNVLCFELPNDISTYSIKLNYLKVVDEAQQALKIINEHFRRAPGINLVLPNGNKETLAFPADIKSLAALSEPCLRSILRLAYGVREMDPQIPLYIKFYAADSQKIENFDYMIDSGKKVIPIDIDLRTHSIMTSVSRENIIQSVDFNEERRIEMFGNNLLALHDRDEASIFCVGEYHYSGLAQWFLKNGRLQDVIFVRPYSPYTSFTSEVDYALPNGEIELPNLNLMENAITNQEDISDFVEKLVAKIRPPESHHSSFFATKRNYDAHNINLALRQAANAADLGMVRQLLAIEVIDVNDAQVGINPKTGKPFSGRTALHQAIIALQKEVTGSVNFEKALQIIKILIQHGADPSIKDVDGKSCIDIAENEKTKELLMANITSASAREPAVSI